MRSSFCLSSSAKFLNRWTVVSSLTSAAARVASSIWCSIFCRSSTANPAVATGLRRSPCCSQPQFLLEGSVPPSMPGLASATSCPLRRPPPLLRDLPSCCRCRAFPHRSGSRPVPRSRRGADGLRRPIPDRGRMGISCRSQRIRRPHGVRLVLVAQLLLGRMPEFFLAAFRLARLFPQAVRAFSDVVIGRLRHCISCEETRPHPGGYGGLEAGPCRPANRRRRWPAESSLDGAQEFLVRSGGRTGFQLSSS